MPTVQMRKEQTAFKHTGTYGATSRTAYAPQPLRQDPPAAAKAIRSRQHVQFAWIGLILIAAMASVGLGLAYLSAYASITNEGYRKARLKAMLQQEQEKAQSLRELRGHVMTPAKIEERAKAHGMIRADDNQAITLNGQ